MICRDATEIRCGLAQTGWPPQAIAAAADFALRLMSLDVTVVEIDRVGVSLVYTSTHASVIWTWESTGPRVVIKTRYGLGHDGDTTVGARRYGLVAAVLRAI